MPKNYLKKLHLISKYDWKYEEHTACFFAEIDKMEEARFVAMKVIATITQELPSCYCAYLNDRTTIFTQDRFGYRSV